MDFSSHPALSARPAPPPRATMQHLVLRAWCVVTIVLVLVQPLFTLLWGGMGTAIVFAASATGTIVLWLVSRLEFSWKKLPWFVLAFLAWMVLCLAWSAARDTDAARGALLFLVTAQGLFTASLLSWRELVRTLGTSFAWVIAGMCAVLVWGTVTGTPLPPIFGSPLRMSVIALLAVLIFAVLLAAALSRRSVLLAWLVLSIGVFVWLHNVIALIAVAAAVVVLGTQLVMRTARVTGARTKYYLLFAAIAAVGCAGMWLSDDGVFSVFPVPVETGVAALWPSVLAYTGIVGVIIVAAVYLTFVWRAWFFGIDRPRWDLRNDRPYSPLTLLPTLLVTILLIVGAYSALPLEPWAWMVTVLLLFKITQAPLVGVGPLEHALALESGELVTEAAS